MGCGITQIFSGCLEFSVSTFDSYVSSDDVQDRILGNLQAFLSKGLMTQEDATALLGRVNHYEDLAEAVSDADLIIECIPENMALKQDLFCQLEKLCRLDTIFATNTSVMSISEIASKAESKKRIVGTHFWNPPYLIPLVEVIKSDFTDEDVVDATMAVLKTVGKHPVRVNKDVPGFLANRLQHALWREAISIVENGIADAQTVDEAIKYSFGMRLPVLAPLENADLVGTDLTLSIHEYVLPHLESSPKPSPYLKALVTSGKLGFKTGKGFMEWTPDEQQQVRDNLTKHLINVTSQKD